MRFLILVTALLAVSFSATTGEITKREAKSTKDLDEKRVVCYYTNWSVYRKGLAKYTPQNINPYMCTHLVYAFGGLTDEFEVTTFDSYQDIEKGGYAQFNGLKQYNKDMKTLLALGGWNEGSARFSELVALKENRDNFTLSVLKHLRRYNFDGLDLDWEYPGSRDGAAPEDKQNYATLVRELREAFEADAGKSSKKRLLLTMAVPAGQNYIDKGYDIPTLNKYLDFFNLLSYDYHSVYEPTVNHHAALFPPPGTSEYESGHQLNIDWTIRYYLKNGASKNKLVMGIPTYGRSYTLLDGKFFTLGSSADGPGTKGNYTNEKGYLAFYEVCEVISVDGWEVRKPYPKRQGPFAFKDNQWVGYDDEKIVIKKTEYVRDNGLGGVMFWTLDSDDFRGLCNGRQYPLIEAAKETLFKRSPTDENEARALSSKPSDSRNALRTSERTTTTEKSARRRPGDRRQRPNSRTAVTFDPLNTPEPPVTPSSVKGFNCKREGFYPNPDDCKQYYWCLESGTAGLGIVAHSFNCPSDLIFNKNIDGCDHPDRVKCKVQTSRGGSKNVAPSTTAIPRTTEFEQLLEDYDYYYYDFINEAEPVVKPLQETTQIEVPLLESNDVVLPKRNSGGNQFQVPSDPVPEAPQKSETLNTTTGSSRGRNRPNYASIQRDGSRKPEEVINEDPSSAVETRPSSSLSRRPQYVTLNRERPPVADAAEGRQESPASEVNAVESSNEPAFNRTYVTLNRQRRPSTVAPALEEESSSPKSGIQYVTITRDGSAATTEIVPEEYYDYYYYDELNAALDANDTSTTTTTATTTTTTATTTTPKPKIRIPTLRTQRPRPTVADAFRRRPSRNRGRSTLAPVTTTTTTTTTKTTQPSLQPEEETTLKPSDPILESVFELKGNHKSSVDSENPVSKTVSLFEVEAKEDQSEGRSSDSGSVVEETLLLFQQNDKKEESATSRSPVASITEPPSSANIDITTIVNEEPGRTDIPVESPKQDSRPFITRTTPRTRVTPRTRNPPRKHDRVPPRRPSLLQRPGLKFAAQPEDTTVKEENQETDELSINRPSKLSSVNDDLSLTSTTPIPKREFKLRFTPSSEKAVTNEILETTLKPDEQQEISTDKKPSSPSSKLHFLFDVLETTTTSPLTESPVKRTTTEKTRFRLSPRPVVNSHPESKQLTSTTTAVSIITQQPKQSNSQRSPRPRPVTTPKTTAKSSTVVPVEYEYVYDYDYQNGALGGSLGDLATLSNKAVIRADGSIECTDTGYFPHPGSCKKFISCSKTVRGFLRGWVYTCPQELVFDPVGGMCNWTETVDCQANK